MHQDKHPPPPADPKPQTHRLIIIGYGDVTVTKAAARPDYCSYNHHHYHKHPGDADLRIQDASNRPKSETRIALRVPDPYCPVDWIRDNLNPAHRCGTRTPGRRRWPWVSVSCVAAHDPDRVAQFIFPAGPSAGDKRRGWMQLHPSHNGASQLTAYLVLGDGNGAVRARAPCDGVHEPLRAPDDSGRPVFTKWKVFTDHHQERCKLDAVSHVCCAYERCEISSGDEDNEADGAGWYFSNRNGGDTLLIFNTPPLNAWMRDIPDDTPLGALTMPGTHESCALYGYFVSQCQQTATPIAQQLEDGVRFFDVRLKADDAGVLRTYHGIRPERSTFPDILSAITGFLADHPSEALIVSIKEEAPPWPHDRRFSALVARAFADADPTGKMWRFDGHVPRLGEMRGTATVFSRFDRESEDEWKGGIGIHPTTWPDSRREGFEWDCEGVRVRVHDWYHIDTFLDIPEKAAQVIAHLTPALTPATTTSAPQASPWTITYTSASNFPLAPPTWIAKGLGYASWWPWGGLGLGVRGVNARVMRWLLCEAVQGRRPRASVLLDFYRQAKGGGGDGSDGGEGLAALLVALNFLGQT